MSKNEIHDILLQKPVITYLTVPLGSQPTNIKTTPQDLQTKRDKLRKLLEGYRAKIADQEKIGNSDVAYELKKEMRHN